MRRYFKLLFIIGSILVIFSLSSLAFLLIQIHHDDNHHNNEHEALLSQNSKQSIKPPITTQSSFSVPEIIHHALSSIPPEKCTNKPSLTSDDECIDSKGSICSCSSSRLNRNGCCYSSSRRTIVNSSPTKFSFSSYAECVSACLLPAHDERRVQNFIKLQYTKRYRGLVRKIVNRFLKKKKKNRSTSSNLEFHQKENSSMLLPEKIFLSKDDVKMLLVRPSDDDEKENTDTNNHFGLWFCGEQCRFDRESIYYETRFKKDGPVFQF